MCWSGPSLDWRGRGRGRGGGLIPTLKLTILISKEHGVTNAGSIDARSVENFIIASSITYTLHIFLRHMVLSGSEALDFFNFDAVWELSKYF